MAFSDVNLTGSQASAELVDVFSINGRGTVLVIAKLDGTIHHGDRLMRGDQSTGVIGIESIRFSNPDKHPPDTIGLIVDSDTADDYRGLIGHRVEFTTGA